jgi:hypothetical protein
MKYFPSKPVKEYHHENTIQAICPGNFAGHRRGYGGMGCSGYFGS